MSLKYLQHTMVAAEQQMDRELHGFVVRFEAAIDVLLKLPHWIGAELSQHSHTGESYYRPWAMGAYLNAGYSSFAVLRDLRSGLYLDAQILIRHLHEVLVQVVHLRRLPREQIEKHFIPAELIAHEKAGTTPPPGHVPSVPKTISFRKMFEAEAPGYYDVWYSFHSIFAHGRIGADMMRLDRRTQPPKVVSGLHFDKAHAGHLSIQAVAVMRGFLARFSDAFPRWDAAAGHEPRSQAIRSMDEMLNAEWRENSSSRGWLALVAPLVAWNPPEP